MRKVFLLIVILCFFIVPCYAGSRAKKEVKKGNLLYNKGEFQDALKKYEEALLDNPDSDVVNFNLGSALYKTNDYKKAITHFEKSLVSDDESLEQNASYNVGNTKYKYGIAQEGTDLNSAVDLLRQSLRHYERAMELDPEDEDAKYNYEFVKEELKRLEEMQQKQQSQEKQEESESEKEQSEQEKGQGGQQEQQQQSSQEERESEEKEDQSQEQQRQQEQEQQAGNKGSSDENEEASQQPEQTRESTGEMLEKEAQMLLDSYRHEEEPKGLLKGKIPIHNLPEVSKDW